MDKLREALKEMIHDEVARQVKTAFAQLPRGSSAGLAASYTAAVLNVDDAAAYVGLKPKTLYNMKAAGEGPPAYKHGRLTVYYPADLDAWLRSHLTSGVPGQSSTSPQPPQHAHIDRLYSVATVAELLEVSTDYVYARIAGKDLPVVELGYGRAKQRIRADDLQSFIDGRSFGRQPSGRAST